MKEDTFAEDEDLTPISRDRLPRKQRDLMDPPAPAGRGFAAVETSPFIPDEVADSFKGVCCYCGSAVKTSHARSKNAKDEYYHLACEPDKKKALRNPDGSVKVDAVDPVKRRASPEAYAPPAMKREAVDGERRRTPSPEAPPARAFVPAVVPEPAPIDHAARLHGHAPRLKLAQGEGAAEGSFNEPEKKYRGKDAAWDFVPLGGEAASREFELPPPAFARPPARAPLMQAQAVPVFQAAAVPPHPSAPSFDGGSEGGYSVLNMFSVGGRDAKELERETLQQFQRPSDSWVEGEEVDVEGNLLGDGRTSKVMAGVYKGKLVAAKLLRLSDPRAEGFPPWAQDLQNELRIVKAKLRHRNIVAFLGAGTKTIGPKRFPMLLYERMEMTMEAYMDCQRPMWSPEQIVYLDWARQLFAGISAMHNFQIPLAHRDICMQNILISADEKTVKLADISSSVPVDGQGQEPHFQLGSLRYVAPEVPEHVNDIRSPGLDSLPDWDMLRADVYSGSLCVWCMAKGVPRPFPSIADDAEVRRSVRSGWRPDSQHMDELTAKVCVTAWNADPKSRPPAAGVARALTELFKMAGGVDTGESAGLADLAGCFAGLGGAARKR